MTANLGDDLKKIILAGIGAAALTSEKAKQMIDEFVKKGELTVEQGKVLNEELKHNVARKVKETVSATVPETVDEISKAASRLTPEELEELKAKIARMEADRREESKPQENAGV